MVSFGTGLFVPYKTTVILNPFLNSAPIINIYMNFATLHKQRKLILLAAAIGLISVFLPWITVSAGMFGQSISKSTNGFHGIGVLAFLAFAGAGIFAFTGNQSVSLNKGNWFAALGCGSVALLAVLIFIFNSSGSMGSFGFADAAFGFGLWIAILAAAGIVVAAWLLKSPGDSLQSGFESLKKNIPVSAATNTTVTNTTAAGNDKMAQLEKLIALKNEGKITEEEYQDLKSKIF